MDLLTFAGIDAPARTGNIVADAGALLLSGGKPAVWRHVQEVAEVCADLAAEFCLDSRQCRLAGLLHDISAVVPAQEMLRYARLHHLPLDAAEIAHPFLLHQRLSAVIAREHFGVADEALLAAIACHTTLRPQASDLDMALFLADKLAWDQPGEPPFGAQVKAALQTSLKHACRTYLDYVMDHGMILQPHQQLLEARRWLSGTGNREALMEIRRFTPADAEETAALIAHTLRITNIRDYSPEYIEENVASHSADTLLARAAWSHMYLVCTAGHIVGCGAIAPFWGSKTESVLLTIFVHPDYQGRGVGRRIIETLEADAYALRARRIEIPGSITACDFYKRMGYQCRNGMEPDAEGLIRMEKFR